MKKKLKQCWLKKVQQLSSVFLVMLMCVPNTLVNVAAAEDGPKVRLSIPDESGTIYVKGDDKKSSEKEIAPGEKVTVEYTINDGYKKMGLNIGAEDTPDFEYEENDNNITFTMPDKNVYVNIGALSKSDVSKLAKKARSANTRASNPVNAGFIPGTGGSVAGMLDPESGHTHAWWAGAAAIDVDGGMAVCIQPLQLDFAGQYHTENMPWSQAQTLGAIQYYGYETTGRSAKDRAVVQYMSWEKLGFVITLTDSSFSSYYATRKAEINAAIAAHPNEIESTGVIYRSPTGQDVVRLSNTPSKGSFTAVKVSDSPDCTDGNSAYSLEGAEYVLYTNAGATTPVTVLEGSLPLRTAADGTMNTIAVRPGTYYLKETKAPTKGFGINTNVIPVSVGAGSTTTMRLTGDNAEPAMFDPVTVMVQKAVSEMDSAGQANGNISNFAGAEFRFSYYSGLYNTADEAKASGNPKASAIWTTNESGRISFAWQNPTSGSWPYQSGGGNMVPLGTLVIDEVKGIPGTITSTLGRVIQFVDSGDHITVTPIVKEAWSGNKNDAVMAFDNVSYKGGVTIVKADNDTKTSKPQGDADLLNVTYSIYNRSAAPVRAFVNGVWTTTAVGGKVMDIKTVYDSANSRYVATTGNKVLPYGTYEAIESSPSTGYHNNGWKQTFNITADGQMVNYTTAATNWNTNDVNRYGVIIGKMDRDANQYLQLGGASLEGVTFEITNKSKNAVVVDGKTVAPNGVVGTIATKKEVLADGSVQYVAHSRADWLPYGTYKAIELNSGKGYLYDGTSKAWTKTFTCGYDGGTDAFTTVVGGHVDLRSTTNAAKNKVSRNDWNFQKKLLGNDSGNNIGARIPFVITSKTTGEKHVIVTDDNGVWGSAWYAHTTATNSNDPNTPNSNGAIGIDAAGNYYVKDESKLNPEVGTWFTGASSDITVWAKDMKSYTINGNQVSVDDNLAAFPYDNYSVHELKVDLNKDYFMLTVDANLHYKDGHDFDYGTMNNRQEALPEIGTELMYGAEGKIAPAAQKVTILDKVSYNNLKPNEDYILKGELHYVDADGKDTGVIANSETSFKASGVGNGHTAVTFENVDTRKCGEGSIVAFEYLYKDGAKVASHEDIKDKNQTIKVPTIKTTLIGHDEHEVDASRDVITLIDTIKYTNLEKGKNYIVSGTLHTQNIDKDGNVSDGGVLVDGEGKEITATTTFAPSETSGEVEVAFTFSGVDIAGKNLVAFENITLGDVIFATHADIEDKAQTVGSIAVKTKAIDKADNDNEIIAEKKQTIIDTVALTNLTIGKEYTVTGTLHVRSYDNAGTVKDEGVLKDSEGSDVTAKKTFTAKKSQEDVELEFTFDASKLAGKDVVVFEQVSRGDIALGTHADINDEAQSIHVPNIRTSLVDKVGTKFIDLDAVEEDGMVTLVDTIEYENLQIGKTYEAQGVLHARDVDSKGKVSDAGVLQIDGKDVESSTTFIPTATKGIVDVTFKFNVKDMGTNSVVAFETVYAKDSNTKAAKHESIDDDKQTIQFGHIKTSIISEKSESQMLEYQEKNSVQVVEDAENDTTKSSSNEVTLVDTVSYTGLTIGKTYHVNGVMHKAIVEAPVVAEKPADDKTPTDTPEQDNSDVVTRGAGQAEGDNTTGNENDLIAGDGTNKDHIAIDDRIVTDGGVLLDRNGKEVIGSTTFVAESVDGNVDVKFTFTPSDEFDSTRLVAFENVVDDNIVIMTHEDITDKAQSMFVLNMATKATSAVDEKVIAAAEKVEVIDTIVYENLVVDQEYTILGTLMLKDGENGSTVATDSDGKAVVSSLTFTPETTSGSVEMKFVVDTRKLHEKTLVVFERISMPNGTVIGVHEDINDENQSVTVDKEVKPVPVPLETGISMSYIGLALIGGIAAITGTITYRKHRKTKKAK